jgi:hypothetical protein
MTQVRVRHLVEKIPRPAKCGAMVWFRAARRRSRPCLGLVQSDISLSGHPEDLSCNSKPRGFYP